MENIKLSVRIEGNSAQVDSDWDSICRTLAFRGLDHGMLNDVYTQLTAGVMVSTRGLTLGLRQEQAIPQLVGLEEPLSGLMPEPV